MKKVALSLIFVSGVCFAQGQSLWQIFQLAHQNAASNQANLETQYSKINAYRSSASSLFPQVSGTAAYTAGSYDSATAHDSYRAHVYTGTVTQQIFEPVLWMSVASSFNTAQNAISTYNYQYQQFIQSVIKQYFAVLQAKDILDVDTAQTKYLKHVFDQALVQYKVGVGTVTSAKQAQASYKEAVATQIGAQNNLRDAKVSLEATTNAPIRNLKPLKTNVQLTLPTPSTPLNWVELAVAHNQNLKANRYLTRATKDNLDGRVSDWMPSVDVVGTISKPETNANDAVSGAIGIGHSIDRSVALNLTWNLFTGPSSADANGANPSSINEGANLYASQQLQELQVLRDTKSGVRQDLATVQSDFANVKRYKASVAAGQAAVDQYQAMFKVGTTTMSDYLKQVSNLYASKQKLFEAEYGYINDKVQLNLDAGILSPKEIQYLNTLLS